MTLKVDVTKSIIGGCGAAWPPNFPITAAVMIALMRREGIHLDDEEQFARDLAEQVRPKIATTNARFTHAGRQQAGDRRCPRWRLRSAPARTPCRLGESGRPTALARPDAANWYTSGVPQSAFCKVCG